MGAFLHVYTYTRPIGKGFTEHCKLKPGLTSHGCAFWNAPYKVWNAPYNHPVTNIWTYYSMFLTTVWGLEQRFKTHTHTHTSHMVSWVIWRFWQFLTMATLLVIAIAIKFLISMMWQTVQRYISVLTKEGGPWSNPETTQNQTKPYYIVLLPFYTIIITEKLRILFQVKETHILEMFV